jgi:hypothetical protein
MDKDRIAQSGLVRQIEARVIAAVDRVRSGQHLEDALVEMKRELIPADKAARRIGGHLHAALGEGVLWIVGIDEQTGVLFDVPDHVDWWASVQKGFNGLAPELTDLRVPFDQHSVLALYFWPDRAPFVVRNPDFGSSPTAISLEVPWRDGTRTRSATREDLLRILLPVQRRPDIDVLEAKAMLVAGGGRENNFRATVDVYITPRADRRVVFPYHKCRVEIVNGFDRSPAMATRRPRLWVTPYRTSTDDNREMALHWVRASDSEVLIEEPGRMRFNFATNFDYTILSAWSTIRLDLHLVQAESAEPSSLSLMLVRPRQDGPFDAVEWGWEPPNQADEQTYADE